MADLEEKRIVRDQKGDASWYIHFIDKDQVILHHVNSSCKTIISRNNFEREYTPTRRRIA
jgi:hypothetical protein